MADYTQKLYSPPQNIQDAFQGADEAGDLRYLHASAAVIKLGSVPIFLLENLTISQSVNRSPIYMVGSIAPVGFDVNGVTVNISGQITLNVAMSLKDSGFYPKNEADIIANINRVFDIDIIMIDRTKSDPADIQTEPFITVRNCVNTGSSITVNPNAMLKDAFTAVGTIMERDWDVLKDFNKLAV